MRLLLASNGLTQLGGSETYLLTLGQHLQSLGHEVHVLEGPGGTGTLATDAGLLRVARADALEVRPDRAIVQDAIVAGEVAAAWPDVPQLFVVHSTMHDLQDTSAVPSSVATYVVLNDLTGARVRALAGDRQVVRLTQPIDLDRFRPGPPPNPTPRRLLLFGNNAPQGRHQALLDACESRGIEVDRLGTAAGRTTSDPVADIQRADIVVGYGRCILEAMACGRSAFVFDRFGSDGWVDVDSYAALESKGFNGLAGLDEAGRSDFGAVLDGYEARRGWVGIDLARRHHNAKRHATAVVEVLEGMGPVAPADPDLSFALARVWREQWRWETQAIGLQAEVNRLRNEVEPLQDENRRLRDELHQATERVRLADEAREQEVRRVGEELHRVDSARHDAEQHLAAVLRSRRYRLGDRIGDLLELPRRALRRRG